MVSLDQLVRKSKLSQLILSGLIGIASSGCRTEPDVRTNVYEVEAECDTADPSISTTTTTSSTSTEGCTPTDWFFDWDQDGYGISTEVISSCEQPAGYVGNALDCDDWDREISPDAIEICDGIDNNCNYLVDDEDKNLDLSTVSTWFIDSDSDGFGNSKKSILACEAPSDYVSDNTDCDDAEYFINPDAIEYCDKRDNDCNDLIDDEDSGLNISSTSTWYLDADNDSYGDPDSTLQACELPDGYVANDTDCNDSDDDINPTTVWFEDSDSDGYGNSSVSVIACEQPSGYILEDNDCDDTTSIRSPGATEICDDIDNDCDGRTDDDDRGLDLSTATIWYKDSDEDGYGDISDTIQACDWPLGYVENALDCNDSENLINPDIAEICDEIDNNCDDLIDDADSSLDTSTGSTFYLDSDSDGFGDSSNTILACEIPSGYVTNNTDCDDLESLINPDVTEVCDSIDNNCNSLIDDEDSDLDTSTGSTFYADSDGDGFGDPSNTTLACELLSGYLEDSSDCNDADSAINPTTAWFLDADSDGFGNMSSSYVSCEQPSGFVLDNTDCDDGDFDVNTSVAEICDGYDNNCNELIDDDDSSLDTTTASTFYLDADGDGFGDASSSTLACDQPTGYVSDNSDCNDLESLANTSLEEICDSIDNNCDGSIDEGVTNTYFLDDDSDGYGDSSETLEACSLPSGYVSDSTDCDDLEILANPGLTEICADGIDNDCDGTSNDCEELYGEISLSEADAKLIGEAPDDWASFSISGPGDINGDGIGDILIGAIGDDSSSDNNGAAYLVHGPISGEIDLSTVDLKLVGEDYGDYAGFSVSIIGDINSDGYSEIAVGARGNDNDPNATASNGAVYLLFGPMTGTESLSFSDLKLSGENSGDNTGYSVSNGDFDGDGIDDILVGAPYEDSGGTNAGVAYLLYGQSTGYIELFSADAKMIGENAYDIAGQIVFNAGDVNGDGLDDILVGAPYEDSGGSEAGITYLMYGPISGEIGLSTADAKLVGEGVNHFSGEAISSAGDLNGDGVDDILIGAWGEDSISSWTGAAYLVNGPISGEIDLSSADAKITGENERDYFGRSVSNARDINGDNYGDILVGAPGDDYGGDSAGATYVFLGPLTGELEASSFSSKFIGVSDDDLSGYPISLVGDINNDSINDILIGANYESSGGSNAGAAYLILGKGGL